MISLYIFLFFIIISCIKENNIKEENKIESLKIILNPNLPQPTKFDEKIMESIGNHKVLLGYLNAYFYHCPIKISPNIIWQLILNAFSDFVNENYEELRQKFVDFKGKQNLIFYRRGTLDDINKYKDGIIEELNNKISDYIGNELNDILTPNFTTSTKETIIAGKASIMTIFKKYFHFGGAMYLCGIPYIILEGTLEDWEKIFEKLKYLSKYKFERFGKKIKFRTYEMKEKIVKIIETKKGNIDLEFWRNIIMETKINVTEKVIYEYKTVEKEVIRGWICDFYPSMNMIQKNSSDLKNDFLEVPLVVKQHETGETKKIKILTGITDIKQDPNTFLVEPIVNYKIFFSNDTLDYYDKKLLEDL